MTNFANGFYIESDKHFMCIETLPATGRLA